jgi:Fe-S oxidoreductase
MGIKSLIFGNKEKVLYFSGCEEGHEKVDENYNEIMIRLGIKFVFFEKLSSCGLSAYEFGNRKLAKKLAEDMNNLLLENSITKIITPSALCLHMFKNIYPRLLRSWNIHVEHISVCILVGLLKKRISYLGENSSVNFVYHDSCYLGRCCGIYDEPRKVIKLLGGTIFEFRKNREDSVSCGVGGGLQENFPKIANKLARNLVVSSPRKDIMIISACSDCYSHLKTTNANVKDFSLFVLGRLRGKK